MYIHTMDTVDKAAMHIVAMGSLAMIFLIGIFIGKVYDKVESRTENNVYERMHQE